MPYVYSKIQYKNGLITKLKSETEPDNVYFCRATPMQRICVAQYMLVQPCICWAVRHTPVLYRNGWTDRAGFQHRRFP